MRENKKEVKEALEQSSQELAEEASREMAEQIRENTIDNLSNAEQGAEGLVKYVGQVKQSRDRLGHYASGYEFEINHPTAKLHERGGPIEPTYGRAMTEGWDRDGFYDALKDCEYMVRKKRYLRNAVREARNQVGDQ